VGKRTPDTACSESDGGVLEEMKGSERGTENQLKSATGECAGAVDFGGCADRGLLSLSLSLSSFAHSLILSTHVVGEAGARETLAHRLIRVGDAAGVAGVTVMGGVRDWEGGGGESKDGGSEHLEGKNGKGRRVGVEGTRGGGGREVSRKSSRGCTFEVNERVRCTTKEGEVGQRV
jgi:hypothetical protein